jgi:hypothetical protein
LRIAEATSDTDVLNGLQKQRRAWHRRQFATKPGDYLVGGDLAVGERLERHEHEARVGLCAAGEADHVCHRRILAQDRNELFELLPHELERNALVRLDAPDQTTGVLLREKALRNRDEEISAEAHRREQHQRDRALMAQRPGERATVHAQQAIEHALACPKQRSPASRLRMPEQQRAHHRRRRQRDRERYQDCHR